MKTWLSRLVILGALLALLYVALIWFAGRESAGQSLVNQPALAQQIKQGEYLVRLGNCMACHTARGKPAFAGGRALQTPFGTVYTPNLTMDVQHGLGAWNADDFWRALHYGKSRDGRLLNPAFPYPNYTHIQRADSDAMFAYLRSLPAVPQANKVHELQTPYGWQISLAIWRILHFTPGVAEQAAQGASADAKGQQILRGRYLVQGLGHCSACHAARDKMGAHRVDNLQGGQMPVVDWYAGSLHLAGAWTQQDLQRFLQTGVAGQRAAYGPMAGVIYDSLQYLQDDDAQAMSAYLLSLSAPPILSASSPQVMNLQMQQVLERGGKLYQKHCQDCHGAQGEGVAQVYPALAASRSLQGEIPVNAVRLVLHGGFAPGTRGNPRPYGMPPFGPELEDQEVAAILSYLRHTWGGAGTQRQRMIFANDVARYRAIPGD